ncbi:hypothetical protein C0Q70_14244 [Pomacea canaliculata]|uniref:Uncharacterized protein n=1 Tax=Pomacea canaliculata TaxID=400727 RepID=A0A2T7NZH2_POMCA|nr:hypothetical protein C0Q70_14244 [Pomacea canaliculata]
MDARLRTLKQLDVGTDIVLGVNSKDEILYRRNITDEHPTGSDWVTLDGRLKYVTVSPHGAIWGVSPDDLELTICQTKSPSLGRRVGLLLNRVVSVMKLTYVRHTDMNISDADLV